MTYSFVQIGKETVNLAHIVRLCENDVDHFFTVHLIDKHVLRLPSQDGVRLRETLDNLTLASAYRGVAGRIDGQ